MLPPLILVNCCKLFAETTVEPEVIMKERTPSTLNAVNEEVGKLTILSWPADNEAE